MFEPSDTWKQTQGDRPVGVQRYSIAVVSPVEGLIVQPILAPSLLQLRGMEIECGPFGIILRKGPYLVAPRIMLVVIDIARIKMSAAPDV